MEGSKLMRLQPIWGNRCNSEPIKKCCYIPLNQRALSFMSTHILPISKSGASPLPGETLSIQYLDELAHIQFCADKRWAHRLKHLQHSSIGFGHRTMGV